MTELAILIKEVHAKGFNISMMINLYKKKQRERKSTYAVPDSVFCDVCKEYLKRGGEITQGFPYFMSVLSRKAQESCANGNIKEAGKNKFGKMPESIRQIMQSS